MSEVTDKYITIKPFAVAVPANVYGGKYYEIGVVQVRVLADSAEDAIAYVNSHKEEVLAFVAKKKLQNGKKLVETITWYRQMPKYIGVSDDFHVEMDEFVFDLMPSFPEVEEETHYLGSYSCKDGKVFASLTSSDGDRSNFITIQIVSA